MALTAEFPQHADFFDIPAIRITGKRLRNHNALLRQFDGTNGMKTGYVCASGFNVVVRTKRDDRELIAVVLGHRSGFERSVAAAELLAASFERDGKAFRPTLETVLKPANTSPIPHDITRSICPGKYPERIIPDTRPPEAPSAQDFDGIDTSVLAERREKEKNPLQNLPVPTKRPFHKFVVAVAGTEQSDTGSGNQKPSETDPAKPKETLKQRAKLHLKARRDLRSDVVVALGGGTGPNPFGIKHTEGGVYKPLLPIPQKRPVLDSKQSQE